MDIRMNAGFIITDSVHIGDTEFVIGVHSTAPHSFVTWQCRDGSDYFWGHYFEDRLSAERDLLERAGRELEYQSQNQEQKKEPKTKKRERER